MECARANDPRRRPRRWLRWWLATGSESERRSSDAPGLHGALAWRRTPAPNRGYPEGVRSDGERAARQDLCVDLNEEGRGELDAHHQDDGLANHGKDDGVHFTSEQGSTVDSEGGEYSQGSHDDGTSCSEGDDDDDNDDDDEDDLWSLESEGVSIDDDSLSFCHGKGFSETDEDDESASVVEEVYYLMALECGYEEHKEASRRFRKWKRLQAIKRRHLGWVSRSPRPDGSIDTTVDSESRKGLWDRWLRHRAGGSIAHPCDNFLTVDMVI